MSQHGIVVAPKSISSFRWKSYLWGGRFLSEAHVVGTSPFHSDIEAEPTSISHRGLLPGSGHPMKHVTDTDHHRNGLQLASLFPLPNNVTTTSHTPLTVFFRLHPYRLGVFHAFAIEQTQPSPSPIKQSTLAPQQPWSSNANTRPPTTLTTPIV